MLTNPIWSDASCESINSHYNFHFVFDLLESSFWLNKTKSVKKSVNMSIKLIVTKILDYQIWCQANLKAWHVDKSLSRLKNIFISSGARITKSFVIVRQNSPVIRLLLRNSFVSFDLPRKISGARMLRLLLSRYTLLASTGISLGTLVRFLPPHCMMFTCHDWNWKIFIEYETN